MPEIHKKILFSISKGDLRFIFAVWKHLASAGKAAIIPSFFNLFFARGFYSGQAPRAESTSNSHDILSRKHAEIPAQ